MSSWFTSIPFLDTRITRKVDGKLDVTVYRKPTHTDRYLHFKSHHPTHVKKRTGKVPLRPRQEHHERSIESRDGESPPLWCLEAEWLPGSLRQSSIAGKVSLENVTPKKRKERASLR